MTKKWVVEVYFNFLVEEWTDGVKSMEQANSERSFDNEAEADNKMLEVRTAIDGHSYFWLSDYHLINANLVTDVVKREKYL